MPDYTFRFTAEFWWTIFLFVIGTVALAFYADTANAADWTGKEWAAFGINTGLSLGRAIAGFVLGAIGMSRSRPESGVQL